jgi:succinate-semialdehyde dehydrogenase / glutarate-semialdehyde dehydrogenase
MGFVLLGTQPASKIPAWGSAIPILAKGKPKNPIHSHRGVWDGVFAMGTSAPDPSRAEFTAVNPTTDEVVQSYRGHTEDEIHDILEAAWKSYLKWRLTDFETRAGLMQKAAKVLRRRADEFAGLMALEMGKPLKDGRAEAEKCATGCDYFAAHAEEFLKSRDVPMDGAKAFVIHNPLGVILALMPWNFPFWQVFRFAAPTLMAGNTAVLKHANNVPGCALAVESVFRDAGFPDDVFRTLMIDIPAIEGVIRDPRVAAVSLTGSVAAGKAVARQAGDVLKKCVLELGGSDAYIILEDADLPQAAATCAKGRLINTGQSCIAAKRFLVPAKVRADFEELLVKEMQKPRIGDPLAKTTDLGPMARRDLRERLHEQVEKSRAAGARVLLGGEIPAGPGAFYPATVLTDVREGCPAYHEELFGPVASVIPVDSEDEALRVANSTDFGLGSAVFTRDLERGERIAAQELEAGSSFVNEFVRSDPRLPFGGIKQSGYGRELSTFGIHEFVNIKAVYVKR